MKCRILCSRSVYPWAIGEYIEVFSTAYLKIEILRTVISMYSRSIAHDDTIFIKTKNIDVYKTFENDTRYIAEAMTSIITIAPKKEDYYLFGKNESPEMFWNIFEKNSRPDIYLKYNNNYLPILETPNSKLTFNKIEVNSPPSFDLTGAGSTIVDLVYAKEREDRRRAIFQNEMVDQSIYNLQGIIRTEELIESANVSNGIKEYAKHQLSSLMDKQKRINEKIGVSEIHINELG